MSATLNARLFERYFSEFKTTVVDIPGRTFPVERMFLEDAIEISGYDCRKGGGDFVKQDRDWKRVLAAIRKVEGGGGRGSPMSAAEAAAAAAMSAYGEAVRFPGVIVLFGLALLM